MFAKTHSSSTPYLRPKISSTPFSSKNPLSLKFAKSPVLLVAMENLLWELTIIQTEYHLPGFLQKNWTLQESLFTSMHVSLLCIFYSEKTLLITGISSSFLSFFNNNVCYYIMNIYSNSSHSTLKYLKDTEVNIDNILIMTGDFNIRDSLWDSSFPFHSSISDDLTIIADSFNLTLSTPTNHCSTRYSDIAGEANSVIDLMFLQYGSSELNHHSILPECHLSSNHTPLSIDIPIYKEVICTSKLSIPPKSD